jgi:uncharacterized repeat protein (TIGR02543 family)
LALWGCNDMSVLTAFKAEEANAAPNPTYTLSYNGNGNTSGLVPIDNNNYDHGDGVTVQANNGNLIKTGYTFVGWNTLPGGGTNYSPGANFTMGTSSVTLYAAWTSNPTYTVTYNGNGSTGGSVPTDSNNYAQGGQVIILANTGSLVKTGYTFAGWNTQANGLGTSYSPGDSFSMGSGPVTLYAVWTSAATYTVTYNANGGNGHVPVDPNNYVAGAQVTALTNNGTPPLGPPPGPPPKHFDHWNTQANGNGTNYNPGAVFTMGSGNVTLYAIYANGP